MKIKLIYFILILFIISCCPQAPELIKDEIDLPQDHTAYVINDAPAERFILPAEDQIKMNEDYDKTYFSVWHNLQPAHASLEKISLIFKRFAMRPGYGENKKKHSAAWLKKLQQNAFLENFPNTLQPAITTRNTNLRMLPTQGPHFYSSDGDIAGWPFDNLQISSVTANTPIIIFHLSADKSWALVETSFAFGWMPVEDCARVDEYFIKTWESGHYAVIIKDKTSILDADGNFSIRTSIGQIFPLVSETADKLEILIATADKNNTAVIKRGFVSSQVIAQKPLPFTDTNAMKIANELIDEPYGWGGLYGNRDCSAMTRDFVAPFGIWLPRHSADQAKKVGTYINLENLNPEEKEKIILEQGIPYLSLLWRKGHVMLYIGQQNSRALIFHNVWGLKTKDLSGREGRKIIGKAVITTLYPGAELYCIDPEGLLLKNISAMTILGPVKQNQQTQQDGKISPAIPENNIEKTPTVYN
jgi:cell wall-associated NlpC family hydrolase